MSRLGYTLNSLLIALVVLYIAPIASGSDTSDPDVGDPLIKLSEDLYASPSKLSELYSPVPVVGQVGVLVIFVYFADVQSSVGVESLVSRLYGVTRYYSEASYGRVYVEWLSYSWANPWLRLPNTMAYYGAPCGEEKDCRLYDFIRDSLRAADPYVDFRRWRYILIVHAGGDEAITGNPNDIWSSAVMGRSWPTGEGYVALDIAVVSESDPMGAFAHELGHSIFKWPDLYDKSYRQEFVGRWDLMAEGAYNGGGESPAHPTSWCRIKAGWIGPSGVAELRPGSTVNLSLSFLELAAGVKALRIPLDDRRYYLIEARARIGFDSYLPGEGVLILYVDESLKSGEGIVRVVDSTPGDGDVDNGQWGIGQMFLDRARGLGVFVISRSSDAYSVQAQYAVVSRPQVMLSFASGPAGVYVQLSGAGFSPAAAVSIYFDSRPIGRAAADANGYFSIYVRVPTDASPGQHLIRAVDQYGSEGRAAFTVTQAVVQILGSQLKPGAAISISASGLGPRIPYMVKIDDLLLAIVSSDMDGTINISISIPPLGIGIHRVRLVYPGPWWSYEDMVDVGGADLVLGDGVALRSELDERVRELRSYIDSMRSSLYGDLSALALQVKQLNSTFSSEVASIYSRLNSIGDTLQRLGAWLERIGSAVEAVNRNVSQLSIELIDLRSQLTQANASLSTRLARAEEMIYMLNTSIQALNKSLAETLEMLDTALSRTKAVEEKLEDLSTSTRQMIVSLVSDIENLRSRATQLQSELEGVRTRLASIDQQIGSLRQQEALLETALARQADRVESLGQTLLALRGEVNRSIARLTDSVSGLEQKLAALQDRFTDLEGRLHGTSALIAVAIVMAAVTAGITISIARRR